MEADDLTPRLSLGNPCHRADGKPIPKAIASTGNEPPAGIYCHAPFCVRWGHPCTGRNLRHNEGMKIAILGVGSFVFGPSVLHDAIVQHQFPGMHLALFDPNRKAMELMARVGEQMARAVNLSVRITCHDSQVEAISSADFVVSTAAVELQKRFGIDCEIIGKLYPDHLITEFGGVAGISYTLRQIPLMCGLAKDMVKHCPKAWLLTSSNPLPRVCQAVHEEGIQVAGFCSNSAQVLGSVGQMMLGVNEPFP